MRLRADLFHLVGQRLIWSNAMTTTLTFRNAVSAFVRRRNRWENAVLIPIQTEESMLPRHDERPNNSKVNVFGSRLRSLLRRSKVQGPKVVNIVHT